MYKKTVKNALDSFSEALITLGANPYRIDLPRPPGIIKMGVDDFLVLNGKKAKKAFKTLSHLPLFLAEGITGSALLKKKFEAKTWIILGLLAAGLTIFAGKPKIGKSWLVLELALALSSGKKALGSYDVENLIEVAYLALEDSESRLKDRLNKIGATPNDVERIHFFCEWKRAEDGGLLALERWLEQNPRCKVLFIDTLARIRRASKNNNSYYEDYDAASELKKIADKYHVAIVVVHHLRKQAADDPFDAISGTNGISGSADTNMVLLRDRGNLDGVLHITGRDVSEQELALSFKDCVWKVIGNANQVYASRTQQEILLLLLETGEPMTPTEIARETGRKVGGLSKTLRKMVTDGLIKKLDRGRYVAASKDKPAT